MRLSFTLLFVIMSVLIALQYYIFGFDSNNIQSLNINIISNIIILFATVFVLEKVIRNHYESKKNEEEKLRYKNTLNSRHNKLVKNLESLAIQFVTSEPAIIEPRPKIDEIKNIGKDADEYINLKLMERKYNINRINSEGQHNIEYWSHTDFTFYFKKEFLNQIRDYITIYLPLIPSDLLKELFELEDLMSSSNAFFTLKEHGIIPKLENITYEKEYVDFVINEIRKVIDKLVLLREY